MDINNSLNFKEFSHKPVLLDECLGALDIKPEGIYIDGTLGGAGHSSEIYKRLNEKGTLIGIDQDIFALESAQKRLLAIGGKAKMIFENTNFKNLKSVCSKNQMDGVDGILLDLGVSSHQLDEGERGFSYQQEAELDMRMDRRQELTAKIIINKYTEEQIKKIIRDFGEEKWASRIAQFIVAARKEKPIEKTTELVDIIKAAIPSAARRDGPHPAKRTFQAIRIAVNNELGILEDTIIDAVSVLNPGGRLAIITFHSLEDRIVKNVFNKLVSPCTCPSSFPVCICNKKSVAQHVTRKPLISGEIELEENPRARSAKLRVLVKL